MTDGAPPPLSRHILTLADTKRLLRRLEALRAVERYREETATEAAE